MPAKDETNAASSYTSSQHPAESTPTETSQPLVSEEPWSDAEVSDGDSLAAEMNPVTDAGVDLSTAAEVPPFVDEVSQYLQQVMEGIQQLQRAFDSKIRYDQSKQQTIDAMHEELQLHRQGLHFHLLRPIFLDLIDMYGDLEKLLMVDADVAQLTENESRLLRNLRSFQSSIEEILFRHGVETFSEDSDMFVAQRQRAVKVVETDEQSLDGAIAQRVRRGFVYAGRVLRPETVIVFRAAKKRQNEEQ